MSVQKKNSTPKWFKPNFDTAENKSPNDHTAGIPVKNKSKKKQDIKLALFKIQDHSNITLLERVSPKNIADLAVNIKKVSEVEEWLKYSVINNDKISVLLLTGPTGSGKTATVQVLCKHLKIKVIEWVNSPDIDFEEFRGPGQTAKFTEFLIQSSRYPSLLLNTKKQVIVVEDFPNSIVYKPSEFENILEVLTNKGKYSAIFICTDSKENNSDLAYKLFPEPVKFKFKIHTISFNPASATLLKGALKRVSTIIQEKYSDLYQCPTQNTIDAIINSTMGDIRSAVNYFNFACLKGSANLPSQIEITQLPGTKRKRKEKDKGTLTNMCRDETLDIFHGVGRVLYAKRVEVQNTWKFERQPETIVDQFITMPTLFTAFLHENYLRYFGDFIDVVKATELLSDAELLLEDWKDHNVRKYGLWIAIMGLMVSNKNCVSKWNPIQGPKYLKHKYIEHYYESNKVNSIDLDYYNTIKPPGFVCTTCRFE